MLFVFESRSAAHHSNSVLHPATRLVSYMRRHGCTRHIMRRFICDLLREVLPALSPRVLIVSSGTRKALDRCRGTGTYCMTNDFARVWIRKIGGNEIRALKRHAYEWRDFVARSLELLFIVESPGGARCLGQNGAELIVELRGDGGRAIRHNQRGASGTGAGAGAALAKQ